MLRRLIDGSEEQEPGGTTPNRLLSQAEAAKILSVSRATVWRLVRKKFLNPVEILPGEYRYDKVELDVLADKGWRGTIRPSHP
jgi:predicted DNA-binding transcriptional regulator AlpA